MTNDLIKSKLKAVSIHLGISAVIFIGILYLVLVEWYPGIFFEAEGGVSGLKLLAAVDLVLGPLLTLIIFNHTKAKKEIVFDMTFIALIQISALTWGGLLVYSERPVAMVMWEGTFYTVTEDYYNKQNINLTDIASFSDEKPLIIYAETNDTVLQHKEILRLTELKIPPYAQVHLYLPVKENFNTVLSHQLSDDFLLTYFKQEKTEGGQHVFLGKAKHKNLLVHLNSDANLLKITVRSEM